MEKTLSALTGQKTLPAFFFVEKRSAQIFPITKNARCERGLRRSLYVKNRRRLALPNNPFSGPKFDTEKTSLQRHIWTINSPYMEIPQMSTLEKYYEQKTSAGVTKQPLQSTET